MEADTRWAFNFHLAKLTSLNISTSFLSRAQASLSGVQCLLAIRRYELEHRTLPTELDTAIAISPLKQTPRDPFADGPMKYAILDSQPTIYSNGIDGKDDGGKVDSNWGQQPGDFLFRMKTLPMDAN